MMHRFILTLILALTFIPMAYAEEPVKRDIKDVPKTVSGRTTPVAVEHDGADTAGTKLAFQLKELFNSSSLFDLSEKDMPKIKILISTQPEFKGRPEIGSAYAVTWVYSESEGNLQYYLSRDVGLVSETNARTVADHLAERTDEIAIKYGYLFER